MSSDDPLFLCVSRTRAVGRGGGSVRDRDHGRGPAGGAGPVRSSIPAIDSARQGSLSDEDESEDNNSESDAPHLCSPRNGRARNGVHTSVADDLNTMDSIMLDVL